MCTNITLIAKDKSVVTGRSMEDAIPMFSQIIFRAAGFAYHQDLEAAKKHRTGTIAGQVELDYVQMDQLLSWTGTYAVIGLNALGTDIICHGMNEVGLVAGDLVLKVSEYQEYDPTGTNLLVYPYFVNWLLSMHGTCEEVKNNLTTIKVINPFLNMPEGFLFHYPVTDAQGHSIVIEFTNGKATIYDNNQKVSGAPTNESPSGIPISGVEYRPGVLTNDPVFPWQLTNLTNYPNIAPQNFPTRDGNNFNYSSPSEGTGFLGLPGSPTPVGRFVRAAMMTNYANRPENPDEAVNLTTHIMNTVDIPKGTTREAVLPIGDYTQWIVITDSHNKRFYVRDYRSPQMMMVDFKRVLSDFSGRPDELDKLTLSISEEALAHDITPSNN